MKSTEIIRAVLSSSQQPCRHIGDERCSRAVDYQGGVYCVFNVEDVELIHKLPLCPDPRIGKYQLKGIRGGR